MIQRGIHLSHVLCFLMVSGECVKDERMALVEKDMTGLAASVVFNRLLNSRLLCFFLIGTNKSDIKSPMFRLR